MPNEPMTMEEANRLAETMARNIQEMDRVSAREKDSFLTKPAERKNYLDPIGTDMFLNALKALRGGGSNAGPRQKKL